MLSKKALEEEFNSPQPKPHALQFYHLVVSTFSACQSVGVQLKIFCANREAAKTARSFFDSRPSGRGPKSYVWHYAIGSARSSSLV
jgi:hypothetical protein